MTIRQKNYIKIDHFAVFSEFEVTRYDNEAKVKIKPGMVILIEKLGIGPGCQVSGLGPSFLCIETIDQIRETMAGKQPETTAAEFVKIDEVTGEQVIGFDRVVNKLGL